MSARRVVVTGAAGAIGAACAAAFAEDGWEVVAWDRKPHGPDAWTWRQVDVVDEASVRAAAAELDGCDAVVSCAGIASRRSAVELPSEEWQRVLDVNVNGTFHVARALHAALAARRGVLVTIGSVAATAAFRERSAYCASKAAVLMLTQCLAIEWAADGIRTVTVSPGFTDTPMARGGIESGRTDAERLFAHTPQGGLVPLAHVAAAIVAATGPAFASVTGSELRVDGGFNALNGF